MVTSLTLNKDWDISLGNDRNLSIIEGNNRALQDVCTAQRLFIGENLLEPSRGVRYFDSILGQKPIFNILYSDLREISLTVPNVLDNSINDIQLEGRKLTAKNNIVTDI